MGIVNNPKNSIAIFGVVAFETLRCPMSVLLHMTAAV